ncbi:MAG: hypothetical protein IKL57_05660 [Oscillospiraceae bacterium]|nr:hypothetical protein [Oscillospiraceae bacterium]
MKKLVLISVLAALMLVFGGCSNEEPVLIENENNLSSLEVADEPEETPEDFPSESEEPKPEEQEKPEEEHELASIENFDFSRISGKSVKSGEICFETDNIPLEYAFDETGHFSRWEKDLFSPEIAEIKAADGHDIARFGELSAKDIKGIFAFLDGFEAGFFDEKSELNPHTGGALYFGAYDKDGKELWTATFNGGWLIIHLAGDAERIIYDVDNQNVPWPSFEFLEPEPIAENTDSDFNKLRDIYYSDPKKISFDFGSYTGNVDIGMFTPIYQTVYDYSDGAGFQMFKADIKNGRTFLELSEPTERFYIAYYEENEKSTMELYLEDGIYKFGMKFTDDKYDHFAMPKNEDLVSIARKLDLSKTECRYLRIIGYADGIFFGDGANEYFYVIGTGIDAMDDFSAGELVSAEKLAEAMFG